jgi:hypothetical protein
MGALLLKGAISMIQYSKKQLINFYDLDDIPGCFSLSEAIEPNDCDNCYLKDLCELTKNKLKK